MAEKSLPVTIEVEVVETDTPVYYTQTGEVVTDPKVIEDYFNLMSQPLKRKVNIISSEDYQDRF